MLSNLFTEFDKECSRLNLYKVYTIGDCYVAMSFIDRKTRKLPREEAMDMVEFSRRMIDIIAAVRIKIGFNLKMRIGIHTVSFVLFRVN